MLIAPWVRLTHRFPGGHGLVQILPMRGHVRDGVDVPCVPLIRIVSWLGLARVDAIAHGVGLLWVVARLGRARAAVCRGPGRSAPRTQFGQAGCRAECANVHFASLHSP